MQLAFRRTTGWCVCFTIFILRARLSAASAEAGFAGRWDLTIADVASKKQIPSWIELSRGDSGWKALFVGRWGNARSLPSVIVTTDEIRFVSPKEEEGSKTD